MMNNTERASLYDTFVSLQSKTTDNRSFNVTGINGAFGHKLGCSHEGMPMFFVNCAGHEKISDIKLDILSVLFNRKCQITDTEASSSDFDTFSIIQLNSNNKELIKYFIDVIYLILSKLGATPSVTTLRAELIKVIRLFSNPPQFSKEIVRGLWAELLVIDQARDPEYLIESWHVSPEDKFDFNDGQNKIEIKSTSKTERVHVFSLEQLHPNAGSKLLIGSVFVVQSGIGKSVFDLETSIHTRLSNTSHILKLREIILATIGANIASVEKMYFDYTLGIQTLAYYDSSAVPSIASDVIPSQVSKVHFSSDLTDIETYEVSDNDCELFKSV